MKSLFAALLFCVPLGQQAFACSASLAVELETFGQGVTIELRAGTPGQSRVAQTATSSGGTVSFRGLCAGQYFMAIGNTEQVSVTPVHDYEDGRSYHRRIRVVPYAGNISSRSRGSL